jgi:hypothetical protein
LPVDACCCCCCWLMALSATQPPGRPGGLLLLLPPAAGALRRMPWQGREGRSVHRGRGQHENADAGRPLAICPFAAAAAQPHSPSTAPPHLLVALLCRVDCALPHAPEPLPLLRQLPVQLGDIRELPAAHQARPHISIPVGGQGEAWRRLATASQPETAAEAVRPGRPSVLQC